MKEETRRAVAYAAAGRANGKFGSSIYSYDRGRHFPMAESYDYEAKAHIGGARTGGMYHHGVSGHINLDVRGKDFSGYDYDSGSHFTGTVSGSTVKIYDYGDGRYYTYSA